MASAYFRQFAIDNNLTVDYGYMYGFYQNFYISLKETLGSTKYLYIMTNIGSDKETLKNVLSIFKEEELPKYCITDMKRNDNYLQFTFELPNSKCELIVEFINKFSLSFFQNGLFAETLCPICKQPISKEDKFITVDIAGVFTPVHEACYEKGKEDAKKKVKERNEELNKDTKGYQSGVLGAALFSLIYMGILILSFFFVQFILNNSQNNDFVVILQYLPVLFGLAACPIIYSGYETFKGRKGTYKYIIILVCVLISTLLGTFFGFVSSLLLLDTGNTFLELLELVGKLISCKDIQGSTSFRWGFYLYIVIAMGLAILSMVFKFSGKSEMEEANSNTFEKLD